MNDITLAPPGAAQRLEPPAPGAICLRVHGRVQGVGFRPFVARLATQLGLTGCVFNAGDAVVIEVEGAGAALASFQRRLLEDHPHTAAIEGVAAEPSLPSDRCGFKIEASDRVHSLSVRLPPDSVTCAECRKELCEPGNRRLGYPFTTCTACGPRYSILTAMPYDRPATAMRHFVMCRRCAEEYTRPADRRFHSQPNCCAECGPQLSLWDRGGNTVASSETAIAKAADLLLGGQIVALKGLGGFLLLVRADRSDAVARLRQRKNRPSKPLAVMIASLAAAEALADISLLERRLLESPEGPIVLLKSKNGSLCTEVAPGLDIVGLFLPTTPLHYLLLSVVNVPLVATSGNRGEEPIVTDENEALDRLSGIADAFLIHDRPIVRRVDDSVVRLIAGKPVVLRLGRGYAPMPLVALEKKARQLGCRPVLALGGQQKSALALWSGSQAVLSQHIGELGNPQTRTAFSETVKDLEDLYQCQFAAVACDLHPDYFTSRWAAQSQFPLVQVQHHHAHTAACMVEHGLLDREVLALTWDGTGLGTDGTIWGGEILKLSLNRFDRVASLMPFPLAGGEAAILHPNRIAFGLLWRLLGRDTLERTSWPERLGLRPAETRLLAAMLQRNLQTVWTTSMGRLFDAVAALALGIRQVSYEGEAAVQFEAAADPSVTDAYPLPDGDWRPLLAKMLQDLERGVSTGTMAARFHNALAVWAGEVVRAHPPYDVVLGGGCFQNRLLTERTIEQIQELGRPVHSPGSVPPNDGGLAVGQLAVALSQL